MKLRKALELFTFRVRPDARTKGVYFTDPGRWDDLQRLHPDGQIERIYVINADAPAADVFKGLAEARPNDAALLEVLADRADEGSGQPGVAGPAREARMWRRQRITPPQHFEGAPRALYRFQLADGQWASNVMRVEDSFRNPHVPSTTDPSQAAMTGWGRWMRPVMRRRYPDASVEPYRPLDTSSPLPETLRELGRWRPDVTLFEEAATIAEQPQFSSALRGVPR